MSHCTHDAGSVGNTLKGVTVLANGPALQIAYPTYIQYRNKQRMEDYCAEILNCREAC